MQPQTPQNQVGVPTSLPPVAPMHAPQATSAAPAGLAPAAVPIGSVAEQTKLQAKQAVQQYQNNPYQLSGVLQQVKAEYLAKQFNITGNPVEN